MKIKNTAGLSAEINSNGAIRCIDCDPVRISLKAASPFSAIGANIFLRKRNEPGAYKALTGPSGNKGFSVSGNVFTTKGNWDGLQFTCTFRLAGGKAAWQWMVEVLNTAGEAVELDAVYMQDAGLKQLSNGLVNEYYVAQYLERRILQDPVYGAVVCCRQNMKEPTGHPWLMLASDNGAVAGSTDGMQFFGKTYRETGIPEGLIAEYPSGECAGESPVVALQSAAFTLSPGQKHRTAFTALYMPDHAAATSEQDLQLLPALFAAFDNKIIIPDDAELTIPAKNLFNTTPFLPVDDLADAETDMFFGKEKRHAEMSEGQLLSFFCREHSHVMLRAKETLADRPHAHIMQANLGLIPDENVMSTTAFAFGVFNSHISQGNTNFGVLLSVCTSQFNQDAYTGQRIFIETGGKHYMLGVPSAFEMGLNFCRWLYKHGDSLYEVRSWTSPDRPFVNLDFRVLKGTEVNLLITHDFDTLNGWKVTPGTAHGEFVVKPEPGSMLVGKFPQAQFRMVVNSHGKFSAYGEEALYDGASTTESNLFIFKVKNTVHFSMSFIGETQSAANHTLTGTSEEWFRADLQKSEAFWKKLIMNLSIDSVHRDISAISEILPWYGMNAITHYLTPYGLEQFSGAAWGTRDVSQGPVELLLTTGKYQEARQVLSTIFSNQNPDGGWPQWWMFDSFREIRAGDSHGDVFYWVIIALSNYIRVTGDVSFLDEVLPYFPAKGKTPETSPVSEHLERLITMIVSSFIPGTSLVPFGGGDWNDSLQPVSEELATRMISSWTVEMNYQAFVQVAEVYERLKTGEALEIKLICENIKLDFNKYLVKDGVVAGYGLLENDRSISVMLHPSDKVTGVHHSILPMERGILSGIFTKAQADFHLQLIEKHLKGPDGARLMDRPLKYQGGIQTIFQRAESSTFFGREIGLMYVHEHIRYAEALAAMGNAEGFVKALRQAIPIDYQQVVPCGDLRQANCYYSSSDVMFKSRYDADERYNDAIAGKMPVKGGWRVYSSGPGIYLGIVVTKLLGFRLEAERVILDPVMPSSLDGMSASLQVDGKTLIFRYHVKNGSFGPKSITINGRPAAFDHEANPYRQGGAIFGREAFFAQLTSVENIIEIQL